MKGWPDRTQSAPKDAIKQPPYTWDSVSTWKYQDNVCQLYDTDGRLLDTLQLDLLIEDYVQRITESQKHPMIPSPRTTMLKVTEKEHELLQMMQHRDLEGESAVILLHVSRQKFESMIQKLLNMELLQHQSEKEVRLTEKGLQFLAGLQEK